MLKAAACLAGLAHVALLAGLFSGAPDPLSFDTLFRPERGATLQFLADGFRGALASRGFYHPAGKMPGERFGPFDPMAERPTPAQVVVLGAPFAALPRAWRYPAWVLANEALLLAVVAWILRHVADRRVALALAAAWGAGTPLYVALAAGSPVTLVAAALLVACAPEGRARDGALGLAILLRPFLSGIGLHALRTRRWRALATAAVAILLSVSLFAAHRVDARAFLTRHPYGESYPGNLGLQAFLFSAFRNAVPDRPLSIPIAGRVIYDLNILSQIAQRLIAFAFVGLAMLLSLRSRSWDRIAAVSTLWACTWIAAEVEVREGDFLPVVAGAAAMAARGEGGRALWVAALWLALPTPFILLPAGAIRDWSPEFAWSGAQTAVLHAWKLVPVAMIYWLAARGNGSTNSNRSG